MRQGLICVREPEVYSRYLLSQESTSQISYPKILSPHRPDVDISNRNIDSL